MKKVFISYSRTDYVDENGQILNDTPVGDIVEALRATNKIDIWIDVKAKYSGKYFTSVLAKKILWADKILFLSSKRSNESEWVSKEILFAHENKKEILPIRLDDSSFNVDFALILTGIDYIEYYKSPKYRLTDILENVLEDSSCFIDDSDVTINKKDSTNQKERKGCLSLNISYKGCAISMTLAMSVLFAFGLFVNIDRQEDKMIVENAKSIRSHSQETQTALEELHKSERNGLRKLASSPPSMKSKIENDDKRKLNLTAQETTTSTEDNPLYIETEQPSIKVVIKPEDRRISYADKTYKKIISDKFAVYEDSISDKNFKSFIVEYFNSQYNNETYYGDIINGKDWNYIMGTTYPETSIICVNYPQSQKFIDRLNLLAVENNLPVEFCLPKYQLLQKEFKRHKPSITTIEELIDTTDFSLRHIRKELYVVAKGETKPFRIVIRYRK